MTDPLPASAEVQIALAAVREAADLCRHVQQSLKQTTLEKSDRTPVTVADFGSQALVCSRIRAAFPEDPIIGEEDANALRGDQGTDVREAVTSEVRRYRDSASEDDVLRWIDYGGHEQHADRYWTLDPIDGTKGFLRGDQYAIALALIKDGEVEIAALACPNLELPDIHDGRGIAAAAIRDKGAWLYSLDDMAQIGEAGVNTPDDRGSYRFCESVESGHTSHAMSRTIAEKLGIDSESVRLDSQAKYLVVAAGAAEIYMRLPSERRYVEFIWDHAAGSLIVREAGGKVTDVNGNPLDFGHGPRLEKNRGVIVSNSVVHDELITAISQVSDSES